MLILKDGYNGDISAKDAGKIGGNMVRKMIQQAENQHEIVSSVNVANLQSIFRAEDVSNFVFMKYIKAGFDFLPFNYVLCV